MHRNILKRFKKTFEKICVAGLESVPYPLANLHHFIDEEQRNERDGD